MNSHKAAYAFVLDSITETACSGWYSRLDGKDLEFFILVNGKTSAALIPHLERPDVETAGVGKLLSGYAHQFENSLKEGDRIEFWSSHAELMFCTLFQAAPDQYGNIAKPVPDEEPEEDIFDAYLLRNKGQTLLQTYVDDMQTKLQAELTTRLSAMRQCFSPEQLEVLTSFFSGQSKTLAEAIGELRAEMHAVRKVCMTSAEYRQMLLPKPKKYKPRTEIDIPLSSDITGANWWNKEADGRWTGPECRSSLMVPALKPGLRYDLWVEIVDEYVSGAIDSMEIGVNSMLVAFKRDTNTLPTTLKAWFEVEKNYRFPFWILHFDVYKMAAPSERDPKNKDNRKMGVRIKRVYIKPQPELPAEDEEFENANGAA